MPTGVYKRKPLSEETKRKIGLANSIALKGKKLSKERVEKIRRRMLLDNPMRKRDARMKVSKKLRGIVRPRGENSHSWKGNNITYFHFHKWLRDNFGKANKCESMDCSKRSNNFEWSLLKGKKMERNRKNFWQLCVSCHRRYDYTDEQRRKLSLAHKGQVPWNKKANELKAEAEKI